MKNIKKHKSDTLLEKYFEGNSLLSEEKLLGESATGTEQSGGIEKELFLVFEKERKSRPQPFPIQKLDVSYRFPLAVRVAASILCLLVPGVLILNYFTTRPAPTAWNETETQTATQELRLPDGSKVTLNSYSTLRYGSQFEERLVYLTGEAYFDVLPDKEHPFKVISGKATTEVLGTSFNLRFTSDSSGVELEVTEGKVAFSSFDSDLNERIFVLAGEQAVFSEKLNAIKKYESFDVNLIAWKTKKLVFDDVPLKKVLDDAAKYYGVSFQVVGDTLGTCRFSGSFDDAQLQDLLNALQYVLGIDYAVEGTNITLSGHGC